MIQRPTGVYCTIVAQNYLAQALALYESIQAQEPERQLVVLVVDGSRRDLESGRPGLSMLDRADLDIPSGEFDNLAMIYDVVELSTAVKPPLLRQLLRSYDQVVYIDPDMYVVAPLHDIEKALTEYSVVLTPHFLRPIPPGSSYITEVHSLTVGVHNLGFCAVARGAEDFLDWWWGHLQRECLIYPLLGLFVDQKWTDVGASYFGAHSLRHFGYNVGPWNLLERPISREGDSYVVGDPRMPLRLVHFSGFDPLDPEAVSVRLNTDMRGAVDSEAFRELSREYAASVLRAREALGAPPSYGFDADSRGKRLSKRLRRQYRADLLALPAGAALPSAFTSRDRRAFAAWRRTAQVRKLRLAVGDSAIAAKYALPDTFAWFRRTFPHGFRRARTRLLSSSNVRR